MTPAITRSTGVGPALHWMQPETGSGGSGGVGAGLLTSFPGDGSSRDNQAAWSP